MHRVRCPASLTGQYLSSKRSIPMPLLRNAHQAERWVRLIGAATCLPNLMWQAANLKDLELPILIPGIRINTGPQDHSPIEQMQLQRFDGKQWALFGGIITP